VVGILECSRKAAVKKPSRFPVAYMARRTLRLTGTRTWGLWPGEALLVDPAPEEFEVSGAWLDLSLVILYWYAKVYEAG
jgi:hypothetical protein